MLLTIKIATLILKQPKTTQQVFRSVFRFSFAVMSEENHSSHRDLS
ncbi:MAG: hypothetical protein [Phage NG55]|nr:MAG: hypothetical protein [Phage NG55]